MKFEIKVHKTTDPHSPIKDTFNFHCNNSYAGLFNETYIKLFVDEVEEKYNKFVTDLRKCIQGRYGATFNVGIFDSEIIYDGKTLYWVRELIQAVKRDRRKL